MLFRSPQIVRDRADELAELETRNTGKPIVEAEFDIADVATCFEYYGGLATKIHGEVLPVPDNALSLALREPIGVAGQIIPWNYPLLMAAWKLAPAICAGCTMVLKPAEQTPLTVLELARASRTPACRPASSTSSPATGETAGAAIVAHPDVDKIAFTGSAEVGKIIMRGAADTLKKISLELGGKSPNIFFADADFEAAVDGALFGVFVNQGEVCSAGSRILVAAADLQEVRRRDGREGEDDQARPRPRPRRRRWARSSAASSSTACARTRRSARAKRSSRSAAAARPAARSTAATSSSRRSSTTSTTAARIAREEIFGPVARVIPFDDEEDALRIANDTLLRPRGRGLDARHLPRDARRSRTLRAGIVWVNHMQPTYVEAPWGGYKQSGIGRELGKWGVEEYLNVKQVYINLQNDPIGWYLTEAYDR